MDNTVDPDNTDADKGYLRVIISFGYMDGFPHTYAATFEYSVNEITPSQAIDWDLERITDVFMPNIRNFIQHIQSQRDMFADGYIIHVISRLMYKDDKHYDPQFQDISAMEEYGELLRKEAIDSKKTVIETLAHAIAFELAQVITGNFGYQADEEENIEEGHIVDEPSAIIPVPPPVDYQKMKREQFIEALRGRFSVN